MKYSQNNEEQAILEYFDGYIGSFCDIGANDGETLSNTRKLALMGWVGVCVEPDPTAYERLKSLYKGSDKVLPVRAAICNKNGEQTFYQSGSHLGLKDSGLLSSLVERETKKWGNTQFKPVKVKTYAWDTIVKDYGFNPFDFISIDAEGMDVVILQQIDLSKTSLVCVEHNGSQTAQMRIKQHCEKYGLTETILFNGENVMYGKGTRFGSKHG